MATLGEREWLKKRFCCAILELQYDILVDGQNVVAMAACSFISPHALIMCEKKWWSVQTYGEYACENACWGLPQHQKPACVYEANL